MEPITTLNPVWNRFLGNMGSAWSLLNDMGTFADKKDEEETTRLLTSAADIFGTDLDEIKRDMAAMELPDFDSEIDLTPELVERMNRDFAELRSLDVQENYAEWLKKNPQHIIPLYNIIKDVKTGPAARGKILRRGALITMFSFYELLIADLIKTHYAINPKALPRPEEQKISLADLRGINPDGLEEIEKYFIAKEADNVLRDNSRKQLQYFKDKLKVQVSISDYLKDAFWELSQRRNLIVHNDGIVDELYLSSVDKSYIRTLGLEKGMRLNVTPEYILHAYDTLLELGGTITQLCWRRWLKSDTEKADRSLSESIFTLLEKGRYTPVKNLAKFAAEIKLSSPSDLIILVNRAIAERETQDSKGLEKSLRKIAGFPSSMERDIALSLLDGDQEKAYELLIVAKEEGKIQRFSFRWPLFIPVQNEPRFISLFEKTDESA